MSMQMLPKSHIIDFLLLVTNKRPFCKSFSRWFIFWDRQIPLKCILSFGYPLKFCLTGNYPELSYISKGLSQNLPRTWVTITLNESNRVKDYKIAFHIELTIKARKRNLDFEIGFNSYYEDNRAFHDYKLWYCSPVGQIDIF